MKILFVWTGVTSYMADCWRELKRQPGVSLKVVIVKVGSGREFDAAKVLDGLDYELVDDSAAPTSFPADRPDVLFAVGWHSRIVRAFVTRRDWRDVPKVCCFDLPWDGSLRRIAARWVLWPFLRHYTAAYVPGAACEKYAKWLRFGKVFKGLFSIDATRFAAAAPTGAVRRTGFLYVGRFAPEKRLDVLYEAYARYRRAGGGWPLDLYGSGALPDVSGRPDLFTPEAMATLTVHGFIQPDEVPRVYGEHGCFALASDFDPWPLVILQACANGMPVVVSDRCTNHFELVRENGVVFPHGDAGAMAEAMLAVERSAPDGEKGRELSRPYDKTEWTRRTLGICREIRSST